MSDIFWDIGLYYVIASGIATALVLLWGWRQAQRERTRLATAYGAVRRDGASAADVAAEGI